MKRTDTANRRLLVGLFIVLTLWGSFLALGAFLFGYDQRTGAVQLATNPIRGLIVLICVLGFLGLWGLLLAARARRFREQPDPPDERRPRHLHAKPESGISRPDREQQGRRI